MISRPLLSMTNTVWGSQAQRSFTRMFRQSNPFTSFSRSSIHTSTPLLAEAPMGPTNFDPLAKVDRVYRFIVGADIGTPKEMDLSSINDPFSEVVLKRGLFPQTANELYSSLKQANTFECTQIFLIAENGQIHRNIKDVDRTARIVILAKSRDGIGPDVLVSTGTKNDSKEQFLQVMGWDPKTSAYNFYQRVNGKDGRDGLWVWSGNSFHALSDLTRNKGPFSGHINGGPVMKELHSPWQNWHSSEASIGQGAFQDGDPFLETDFFKYRSNADLFEQAYKAGASAWNKSRIAHAIDEDADGRTRIKLPIKLLRQIFSTTNFNLISSSSTSKGRNDRLNIPFTFFANFGCLEQVGVSPNVDSISVPRRIYESSLRTFEFELKSSGVKVLTGDTHFAFFVPEPAFEDTQLLGIMIREGIISEKLAASVLMVDFQNPVFSRLRTALEKYIPKEIAVDKESQGADLDNQFIAAIKNSPDVNIPGSPEFQFMKNWELVTDKREWQCVFQERIEKHFELVGALCSTQEAFDEMVKLAESRRHEVRNTGLFEFDLTFPETNISQSIFPLRMTSEGEVISDV